MCQTSEYCNHDSCIQIEDNDLPVILSFYSPISSGETFNWDFTIEPACVNEFIYVFEKDNESNIVYSNVDNVSGAGTTSQSIIITVDDLNTVKTQNTIPSLAVTLHVNFASDG